MMPARRSLGMMPHVCVNNRNRDGRTRWGEGVLLLRRVDAMRDRMKTRCGCRGLVSDCSSEATL
eukprot:5177037-Pleurochrysis_carterae.AAC.1